MVRFAETHWRGWEEEMAQKETVKVVPTPVRVSMPHPETPETLIAYLERTD